MSDKRFENELLATACIPWREDGSLDEARFRALVDAIRRRGVTHIYLFGTAGEGHMVDGALFSEIVSIFADCMRAPGLCPIVGVISLSPRETQARIAAAYALGIRNFQISLPAWGALSDEETLSYFHLICDAFPDCRFMHYNTMRAKRTVDVALYRRLCAEIPNLAAVKFITSDITTVTALKQAELPLRVYFTEPGFAFGSLIGFDCGFLVSLASSNLSRARDWLAASKAGDQKRLLSYWEEMCGIISGFREITDPGLTDGAYDKLFCRLLVPDFPQRMLPPYRGQGDPDAVFAAYRDFLRAQYPAWLE